MRRAQEGRTSSELGKLAAGGECRLRIAHRIKYGRPEQVRRVNRWYFWAKVSRVSLINPNQIV